MAEPEKDPRVYFAAERTFLAWIRTGLALMGFGFVVARFGLFLREIRFASGAVAASSSGGFSFWAGTALVFTGVIVTVLSTARHIRLTRDLKSGRDVTGRLSALALAVATVLILVGTAVGIYLIVAR